MSTTWIVATDSPRRSASVLGKERPRSRISAGVAACRHCKRAPRAWLCIYSTIRRRIEPLHTTAPTRCFRERCSVREDDSDRVLGGDATCTRCRLQQRGDAVAQYFARVRPHRLL